MFFCVKAQPAVSGNFKILCTVLISLCNIFRIMLINTQPLIAMTTQKQIKQKPESEKEKEGIKTVNKKEELFNKKMALKEKK